MARKKKLPGAADFFGGEEAQEEKIPTRAAAPSRPVRRTAKKPEAARSAEEVLAKTMDELGLDLGSGEDDEKSLVERGEEALDALEAAIRATVKATQAPAEPRARSLPRRGGEKVTFYLPPDMVKQIEIIKLELLLEHNWKLSRSQIVQALLEGMRERTAEIAQWAEETAQ